MTRPSLISNMKLVYLFTDLHSGVALNVLFQSVISFQKSTLTSSCSAETTYVCFFVSLTMPSLHSQCLIHTAVHGSLHLLLASWSLDEVLPESENSLSALNSVFPTWNVWSEFPWCRPEHDFSVLQAYIRTEHCAKSALRFHDQFHFISGCTSRAKLYACGSSWMTSSMASAISVEFEDFPRCQKMYSDNSF